MESQMRKAVCTVVGKSNEKNSVYSGWKVKWEKLLVQWLESQMRKPLMQRVSLRCPISLPISYFLPFWASCSSGNFTVMNVILSSKFMTTTNKNMFVRIRFDCIHLKTDRMINCEDERTVDEFASFSLQNTKIRNIFKELRLVCTFQNFITREPENQTKKGFAKKLEIIRQNKAFYKESYWIAFLMKTKTRPVDNP